MEGKARCSKYSTRIVNRYRVRNSKEKKLSTVVRLNTREHSAINISSWCSLAFDLAVDFLKVAVNTGSDGRHLPSSAIKKGNLSKETRSEILLNTYDLFPDLDRSYDSFIEDQSIAGEGGCRF